MEIVTFVLITILCYFISGVIHELGHVIVGLINGWRFYLLVIGPLGIKSDENNNIKFYLEKQIVMWGGVGCTAPYESNNDNIKIWSKVLLGGPVASIVMGVIFLPLGIITGSTVLLLLGAMPLGMGVICILPLPLKTGILYTDGGRWRRLHKGGQEKDEEIALFKLIENQITSSDFSKIDLKSIEPLLKSKEIRINYYGYYYAFQYYRAVSDREKMDYFIKEMNKIKSKVPSIIIKDCKID
ncbi:M50 family metallopeptidase [Pseudobacteroides cellulosolvens]|uniref:Peptidase M50 domain-containing protein n=1 Tax=Pseudobacteroides cellulosolvens ATCC 35603 = DSM 2933 TaxID=398512 RepID=A0A0L6JIZ8_9FIRM|nr:M50 family metallopeptidase [Pseudobacteroides cellulosolvens]KNY25841.1 hypothetical protein Bccel_1101 [Pseudobacteroides cellulosolvens ATCC 35603 = DSM 2933]